jgi:hypothetical protein
MLLYEYLLNPEYFKMLYPAGLDLTGAVISDIHFSYNGPTLTIHSHTAVMPKKRPSKWHTDDNRVVIILEFSDISSLNFSGWGTQNITNTTITKNNNGFAIAVTRNETALTFNCSFIYLKNINSYLVTDTENS